MSEDARERARTAALGTSVGDAFGQACFVDDATLRQWVESRGLPPGEWPYTDDTVMALGILEVLDECGSIDRDRLAEVFARRWEDEPGRGYGPGARRILSTVAAGGEWREASESAFGGEGSYGNGAAMRAAPVGGYFADDLEAVVRQAEASARITHSHPEGIAGAVAVALAAAAAWRTREAPADEAAERILELTVDRMPDGETRRGVERAAELGGDVELARVVDDLGNGSRVTAMDTVPFVIWSAARHLADFEEAMWRTVEAGGDRDTTCAMVGGIVALRLGPDGIPAGWVEHRESISEL